MRIGVPKEIKDKENRVGLTPDGVSALVEAGHEVIVEHQAGDGSGYTDQEYLNRGARLASAGDAWGSELVVKIKEPLAAEYDWLKGQIVFTYFHLAGVARDLTDTLLDSGTTAIAYETIEDAAGHLPRPLASAPTYAWPAVTKSASRGCEPSCRMNSNSSSRPRRTSRPKSLTRIY